MVRRLPTAAIFLGVAGLIPFVGLGLAALSTPDQTGVQRYLLALVGYGAVVLAFLGGAHWGFLLHPALTDTLSPAPRRTATLLAWSTLPSLVGWLALLTQAFGLPEIGLGALIAGFVAVLVVETRALVPLPAGYLTLRWALSLVVLAVLIVVLVLRLIGATLVFPGSPF